MPAPTGNQYALGCTTSGRPPRDLVALANELLAWAQKDTSLNLNGFCAANLLPPQKISLYAEQDEVFREALETTKGILAERREARLSEGTLHCKAYDLNANVYDHFMDHKQEKRMKLEHDYKKAETAQVTEQVDKNFLALMAMLNGNQASQSNIASTTESAESKSE